MLPFVIGERNRNRFIQFGRHGQLWPGFFFFFLILCLVVLVNVVLAMIVRDSNTATWNIEGKFKSILMHLSVGILKEQWKWKKIGDKTPITT